MEICDVYIFEVKYLAATERGDPCSPIASAITSKVSAGAARFIAEFTFRPYLMLRRGKIPFSFRPRRCYAKTEGRFMTKNGINWLKTIPINYFPAGSIVAGIGLERRAPIVLGCFMFLSVLFPVFVYEWRKFAFAHNIVIQIAECAVGSITGPTFPGFNKGHFRSRF